MDPLANWPVKLGWKNASAQWKRLAPTVMNRLRARCSLGTCSCRLITRHGRAKSANFSVKRKTTNKNFLVEQPP